MAKLSLLQEFKVVLPFEKSTNLQNQQFKREKPITINVDAKNVNLTYIHDKVLNQEWRSANIHGVNLY